jgi:hypothetical protein
MLNISYKYDIIFTSFSSLVGVQSLSSAQRQQLHITVTIKGNKIIDFECFAKRQKMLKCFLMRSQFFGALRRGSIRTITHAINEKVVKKISQKLPLLKNTKKTLPGAVAVSAKR